MEQKIKYLLKVKEKNNMSNIAVIGSGSWGMAIAIHLAKLGNRLECRPHHKLQEEQ